MKTTIILGANNDYHARHMLNACSTIGLDALLFDTALYPSQHTISWEPECAQGYLVVAGREVPFSQISSVFWSSITLNQITQSSCQEAQIILNDSMSMLRTFLQQDSILWANSWQAFQFHKVKPKQLSLAVEVGACIPATYVGNNPLAIMRFVESTQESIYKPVYGGAYTARVTKELLSFEHLNKVLKLSPVTIQKFIDGSNVRTYVVGDQVFSGIITTDDVDFRVNQEAKISAIQLPAQTEELARRITNRFGMCWTAIDWRVDQQGNYYFLEANPSPMFIHFEQQTGHPITAALVALLAQA